MSTFRITGGKPLFGTVRVGGAKNASYKIMIAALLANSPSRLLNFSYIGDVDRVASIIRGLGGKAEVVGDRSYMIDPSALTTGVVPQKYGEASRASTLFIPVLLAKLGEAEVPLPGGDKIGARSLERHFDGLKALGATITVTESSIRVAANKLTGTEYTFVKNSHTGTETLLMAAVLAEGTTILNNAAEETEVDDLIAFLNAMGAQVTRTSPRVIEIHGVSELEGADFKIMPDQNQAVSFACAALATKGDVIVEDARPKDLQAFLSKLDEIGAGYEITDFGIHFFYHQPLMAADVTTAVYPGFKTDWQPLWVAMMTQATGVSTLHETIYESRFQYVDALNQMGAQIELFNPPVEDPESVYNFNIDADWQRHFHAARITGPTSLRGDEFRVKDLRHGATLMIAGLIADGVTILHDPEDQIDRGYEALDKQFAAMGATVERLP